eukprot:EG_transcript_9286
MGPGGPASPYSWWTRSLCCVVGCVLLLIAAGSPPTPSAGPEPPTPEPEAAPTAPSVSVTAYSVYCAAGDGPDTHLQVAWLGEVVELLRQRLPQVTVGAIFFCQRIKHVLLPQFSGNRSLLRPLPGTWYTDFDWVRMNAFLLSLDFWRLLEGDKVLIFQPDVWICPGAAARLTPFLRYDYVGAPWGRGFDRGCPLNVGNGGFSLRDRRKALQVLEDPRTPALVERFRRQYGPNEDRIWCNVLAAVGAAVPPPAVAAAFSVENDDFGVTTPVAAHDCVHRSIVLRLEAGCEGVAARMTAIQRHKRAVLWAVQEWTFPLWWLADRLFWLWLLRYRVLLGLGLGGVAYAAHHRWRSPAPTGRP